MKFCCLYTRVSSELQDTSVSLSAQETELRARAEHDGYTVYEVFSDSAESGRLFERPAFQRMIALSKQSPPPFSRIYLWNISRFGRNRVESAVFKQRLRARGIDICYLKENIEDNATGRLIEAIMEALSEYESCNIAEDTRRGHREITRRGYYHGGDPPFGYQIKEISEAGKIRKGFEPHPDTAELVRWIFEQRDQGKSPRSIAAELTRQGHLSPREKKPWSRNTIDALLRNPVYIGRLRYGMEEGLIVDGKRARRRRPPDQWTICEGACEPIVPLELWQRVQEKIRRTPRGGARHAKRVYLLSGILHCSCGSLMSGRASGGYAYYQCNAWRDKHICSGKHIHAGRIERQVLEVIKGKLSRENLVETGKEYMAEVEKEKAEKRKSAGKKGKELERIGQGIGNLMRAIEEGTPARALRERIAELEKKRESIIKEMRETEKEKDPDLEIASIEIYAEMVREAIRNEENPEKLKELLREICRVDYNAQKGTGEITLYLIKKGGDKVSFLSPQSITEGSPWHRSETGSLRFSFMLAS